LVNGNATFALLTLRKSFKRKGFLDYPFRSETDCFHCNASRYVFSQNLECMKKQES